MKKKLFNKLIGFIEKTGVSAQKFAWSIALGTYLAFSPFLGIQTILVFIFSFLLRANSMIVFTAVYAINNPWTMIPILLFEYMLGSWLVHSLMGLNLDAYNPWFIEWVDVRITPYLTPYIGVKKLCFWCYFIGGNIIAIPLAIAAYFAAKRFALKHVKNGQKAQVTASE